MIRRDPDRAIWEAETEREFPEPMSDAESARMGDAYERAMWGEV